MLFSLAENVLVCVLNGARERSHDARMAGSWASKWIGMPLWYSWCLEGCGLSVRAFFAIDCYWPQNTDLLLVVFQVRIIKQDDIHEAPIVLGCYTTMNRASGFIVVASLLRGFDMPELETSSLCSVPVVQTEAVPGDGNGFRCAENRSCNQGPPARHFWRLFEGDKMMKLDEPVSSIGTRVT